MKRGFASAFVLAVSFGVACAVAAKDPVARAKPVVPPRLLVFVGEQLSIGDYQTFDCGPNCIAMDVVWSASYRPLQWLEGGPEPGPVEFSIAGHTEVAGMKHRTALLFVFDRPHRQLARYRIYGVDPTVDGRWAMCATDDARLAKLAQPVAFQDDVVVEDVSRWPAQRVAKEYPAPIYQRRGDRIHCTRGIYVEDLAPIVAREILADFAQ